MSGFHWKCNRCETSASDTGRVSVEYFAEHHVKTMHPLFTAEASKTIFAPTPKRRIRSFRIGQTPSPARRRRLVGGA